MKTISVTKPEWPLSGVEETFAGTGGNDEDAPIAAASCTTLEVPESTQTGNSI
jgi:hypothetical protein